MNTTNSRIAILKQKTLNTQKLELNITRELAKVTNIDMKDKKKLFKDNE